MTRKKWTKPPQETYLLEKRPEFQLAEANNTRKEFFEKMYPDWLARWPNREPTQEEIQAATSREQAAKVIYDFQLEVTLLSFNSDNIHLQHGSVFEVGTETRSGALLPRRSRARTRP